MLTTSSGPFVPDSHSGSSHSGNSHSNKREWLQAHEVLSRLARERAAADAEEGRCLLAALRSAEALEELPAIRGALETGVINWSAVRELTRVAVPETEQEWLQVARGKTVHQLEALVAAKPRAAGPSSPVSPGAPWPG